MRVSCSPTREVCSDGPHWHFPFATPGRCVFGVEKWVNHERDYMNKAVLLQPSQLITNRAWDRLVPRRRWRQFAGLLKAIGHRRFTMGLLACCFKLRKATVETFPQVNDVLRLFGKLRLQVALYVFELEHPQSL